MKNLILYINILISICSNAQSEAINHKRDRYWGTNFYGQVKSSKIQYSTFNLSGMLGLNEDKIIQNEKEVVGIVNAKFRRDGKLSWYEWVYFKDENDSWKKKSFTTFEYSQKDIEYKQTLPKDVNQLYPVYDYFIKPQLDIISVGPTFIDLDSIGQYFEKYSYQTNQKNKIIHLSYSLYLNFPISSSLEFNDEYFDHLYEIVFLYDFNNQLVKQLIKKGKGPGEKNSMYSDESSRIAFHAMGTECGFCEDLNLSYQYDNKNRISNIAFFGCKDTLAYEKYSYNENLGYISKIRRYVGGVGGAFQVTNTTDFYYDAYANVIKREYIPNSYQTNYNFKGMPKITYYKYEYDKYNNWVKCYIYYIDKLKGEPAAVVERKIEYYES